MSENIWSFPSIVWVLETSLGNTEKPSIFQLTVYSMHVFYRGKFDMILFHPKNLLGKAKMPKYGNMGHFHPVFLIFFFWGGSLKLVWKIFLKNLSLERMLHSVYIFYRKKTEMALFHLQSWKFTVTYKNILKWQFSVIFSLFLGTLKLVSKF